MLQCGAVCCSALQCVAIRAAIISSISPLRASLRVRSKKSVMQYGTIWCNVCVLQCVAVCLTVRLSVLQSDEVRVSVDDIFILNLSGPHVQPRRRSVGVGT